MSLFFFGMLVFIIGLNIYLVRRGWQALSGTGALRPAFLAVYLLLFASLFLGRMAPSQSAASKAFGWAGAFFVALFAIGVLLVLIVDLARLVDHFAPFFPAAWKADPRRTGHAAFAAVAGLAVLLIVLGWVHARHVRLKTVEVALDKPAPGLSSLDAVMVSDIHVGPMFSLARLDKLVAKINALRPEIVFIPGDVLNMETSDEDLDRMAAILRKIESRYGVFACPGNHEYYAKLERSLPALRRGGIDVLEDDARVVAGAFVVAGRLNTEYIVAREKRKPLSEILAGVGLERPVILLDHQPARLADSAAAGADLQLSGHTHAGQLIPFSWINYALWQIGYGSGRVGRMRVYVSSGAGVWGVPIRLGTNSELVRMKIVFGRSEGGKPE